jgi:hypothetical protein
MKERAIEAMLIGERFMMNFLHENIKSTGKFFILRRRWFAKFLKK